MTDVISIPDDQTRRLAVTTFDRNVVVVAGAGTGKTTLLVNRFIHTLMREPHAVPITQIVALTFTNKAATEMKIRLREKLVALAEACASRNRNGVAGVVSATELQEQYRLSSHQIVSRAEAALLELEKAQIGTLHSFAAHLLRLYPLESGVDPNFQEDDGSQFEDYFNREWEFWLHRELGADGPNHTSWRRLLADLDLEDVRQLTFALCNEIVSLDELMQQVEMTRLSENLREWLAASGSRVADLLARYDCGRRRKIETGLAAARQLLDCALEQGWSELGSLPVEVKGAVTGHLGKLPSGWDEKDFEEARRLISLAKALCSVDHGMIGDLLRRLVPFVRKVRAGFIDEGWVTFDGLLARARALLRDHPFVRECLKQDYKAILVDEFQDTDPLQYEIVLYLAERVGSCGMTWKDVELTAGKLFIVGDPKQSIYAFRRADLEAFDRVVRKITDSGGMTCELATNFRSHHRVLEVVNAVFERIFQPEEHVQPANVQLMARPNRTGGVKSPGVELHVVKVDGDGEEFDSAAATRLEAERLARWIKEDLLVHEVLTEADGQRTRLRPGHIGLLFRKLTQAQDYLDALRRYDIPYVTDGEKHFYRRQEVCDLVNLLRVVENPSDTIALIGLLRSPLGALSDQEIYELQKHEAFDYRRPERLRNCKSANVEGIRRLYRVLAELNHVALTYPLPALIDVLFSRLPVAELAAVSLHGEQAVANLDKIRAIAAALADRPSLSLSGFVALMIDRLAEQREEAESGLAEESLEAVRVLTVHKAKGLEFPVVILPGLHHGTNLRGRNQPVSQDWATGAIGVSVGEQCTLGAVLTDDKFQAKEDAEQRRVLYVAMTRAKERLILSGGYPNRLARGTFLDLLQQVADTEVGRSDVHDVHIGKTSLSQSVISQAEQTSPKRKLHRGKLKVPQDMETWLRRWDSRERHWSLASSRALFLTPTSLLESDRHRGNSRTIGESAVGRRKLIGVLAHRILEGWDYKSDFQTLKRTIEKICLYGIPPVWFPNAEQIRDELDGIFQVFYNSSPYCLLQGATILGREIPFALPWDCSNDANRDIKNSSGVMEGVIDVVYRLDGQVWIADYKTDQVEDESMARWASRYERQVNIYREAVMRCLGLPRVGCQLLFLRHGVSFEL